MKLFSVIIASSIFSATATVLVGNMIGAPAYSDVIVSELDSGLVITANCTKETIHIDEDDYDEFKSPKEHGEYVSDLYGVELAGVLAEAILEAKLDDMCNF